MIVKQFMDAGWHTVPLGGELKRTHDGGKTIPKFPSSWRVKYVKEFNTVETPLAGTMTGAVSGIVAIDCDTAGTYEVFRELDPNHDFILPSKGKPKGGCTLIYKFDPELTPFIVKQEGFELDFYSDNGFIYLPTEHNETKEAWTHTSLPELREMPPTMKRILMALSKRTAPVKEAPAHRGTAISNRLAPMVQQFIASKEYYPVLFKIITPKDFRDLPQYVKQGHLHPKDVPEGRGSEYLSKVSCILGKDISVKGELYQMAMLAINGLFSSKMDAKRLRKTIMDPMIEQKTQIDGEVVWQYDEHWQKMGFIATATNGAYIESFFDDVTGTYYIINYTKPYVRTFTDKNPCIKTLKAMTGRAITELQYDTTKRLCETTLDPASPFGHIEGTDDFNLFRQTPELDVLNNPASYTLQYKRPEATLGYLESLIPDDFMRAYVLSFLRTKLTTFKYSPVVLYFIGVSGSGKDVLVTLLKLILGEDYIASPPPKIFLEMQNGWMRYKYFVQLDEYGNLLTTTSMKQEALGKIKTYSGSPMVQIRAMHQNAVNYEHQMTMIVTANTNPLPIESNDRRIAFIETPNILEQQDWVLESGGVADVVERIKHTELMDFCYYLATEVKNLHSDEYMVAPKTDGKAKLIVSGMPTWERLVHHITNSEYKELEELGHEFAVEGFTEGWKHGRLLVDNIEALYHAMTDGAGSVKVITKGIKAAGYTKKHSTKDGKNVFFYELPRLYEYKTTDGTGFKVEEGTFGETQVGDLSD